MQWRGACTAALLAIVIVAGAVLWVVRSLEEVALRSSKVYSTSELVRDLVQHPNAWRGRMVLVRGMVIATSSDPRGRCLPPACAGPTYYLLAPDLSIFGQEVPKGANPPAAGLFVRAQVSMPPTLQLMAEPPSALDKLLRQIPMVQRWLSRPQKVQFLHLAVYRVRLQFNGSDASTIDCESCGAVGILQ